MAVTGTSNINTDCTKAQMASFTPATLILARVSMYETFAVLWLRYVTAKNRSHIMLFKSAMKILVCTVPLKYRHQMCNNMLLFHFMAQLDLS